MDLSAPVDGFLYIANEIIPPIFKPVFDQWTIFVESFLKQNYPDVKIFIDSFLIQTRSGHAAKLPLMNPYHVVLIMISYLAVIASVRLIMIPFEKFQLKAFSLIHNLFLTCLSAYMMTEIIHQAVIHNYRFWGNNYDPTEGGWPMAKIIWLFYVSKIVEFIDTLIMALKKNDRQISFLHVYHHITIFAIWWLVTYMAPGGEAYYSAALNSFIHVIMYGYYFFSTLGVKQVSFIKKYITMMQMTQFLTMMMQAGYDLYTEANGYPKLPTQILFFYMITLLVLFLNFFLKDQARLKEERKKTKETAASNGTNGTKAHTNGANGHANGTNGHANPKETKQNKKNK
jgi:hypothetical protein